MSKHFVFILAFIVLFFTACNDKIEKKPNISSASLLKTSWENVNGFEDDNLNLALEVFKKDCGARRVNKNLKDVCKKSFEALDGKEFFITNFEPYKLLNKQGSSKGLITGYYEPVLNGSLTKTDIYKYPIFKTPDDLINIKLSSLYPALKKYTLRGKLVGNTVVPYPTREQIKKDSKNLVPILYVDSKIDRFFLEIQGSGKVRLQDGKLLNLGYAGQNGRKYYPVGRKLIKDGEVARKDMSLQAIKKWCDENPTKVDDLLNLNDSKVFFHISKKTATGSLGVELVAKRNLAVDRSFIPLGFPVFINTTNPINNDNINSMMVSADTGGAIKGDVRADFFWGNGKEAKLNAGKMAQEGILTILIPKIIKKEKLWRSDTSKYFKVKG